MNIIYITIFIMLILIINIKISITVQNNNIKIIALGIIKRNYNEENMKKGYKKLKIAYLLEILKKSIPSISYISSKVKADVSIKLNYGTCDAALTALIYGALSSFIYSIEAIGKNKLKSFNGHYSVNPDFNEKELEYKIEIKLGIRFLYLIIFLLKMLPIIFNYKKYISNRGGVLNA